MQSIRTLVAQYLLNYIGQGYRICSAEPNGLAYSVKSKRGKLARLIMPVETNGVSTRVLSLLVVRDSERKVSWLHNGQPKVNAHELAFWGPSGRCTFEHPMLLTEKPCIFVDDVRIELPPLKICRLIGKALTGVEVTVMSSDVNEIHKALKVGFELSIAPNPDRVGSHFLMSNPDLVQVLGGRKPAMTGKYHSNPLRLTA